MRRVLFLGAGFSAPFGHPVMNTFLPFADATSWLTEDDKNFLGRLTLDARRANSFLESSPTNLEDILSYAVMADRLKLRDGEPVAPRVRDLLRKVYGRVSDIAAYWKQCALLRILLGIKHDQQLTNLSVVTTNYDLNAECALYHIGNPAEVGFVFQPTDTGNKRVIGNLYRDIGVPLFKLHGSVNWYPEDETNILWVDDHIGTVTDLRGIPFPLALSADYIPLRPPLIVPPSFLKPDLTPMLVAVWAGAARVLQEAHEVVFVGYSFPPTDTEMSYFLAHAMASNAHLRRIVVIDLVASAIVARLQDTRSRFGSHFKALLEPVDHDWRQYTLPALL